MAEKIQYCFERYEKKYFLTPQEQTNILKYISKYMIPDEYPDYTICNIYYDTDDWQIIRRCIEKPAYKEKLRVRSYGVPSEDDRVFVELKKKCLGVVYKRRIAVDKENVGQFLEAAERGDKKGQIEQEIGWFQKTCHSEPKIFIAYDRTAFSGIAESDLRITFDTNMRWRNNNLDLGLGDDGEPIINTDNILMEVKAKGAFPLWLCRFLSEAKLYPVSFSKYGTCYREHILKKKGDI